MNEPTWWDSTTDRWIVLEAFEISDPDTPWRPLMTYWASRAVSAGIVFG